MDTYDISLSVVLILYDENHIEARENRWHEVNILVSFGVIPATEHRIRCREDRAP